MKLCLFITAILTPFLMINGSACLADIEDLQVTQIAVQGNCLILTVTNPSTQSVSAKYRATALLADGSEETRFSEGFTIAPNGTLQVSIEYSGIVIGGGDADDPDPWPIT